MSNLDRMIRNNSNRSRVGSEISRVIWAALLLSLAGGALLLSKAQAAQETRNSGPNTSVEGDWVRTDLNASGSFDG